MSSFKFVRRASVRVVFAATAVFTGLVINQTTSQATTNSWVIAQASAPIASCKPDLGAKSIPLYDKPGGAVVRNVDIDPNWQGGPGLSLMESKDAATPVTMWLEIKDSSGKVVGYLSGADGGINCQVPG